MRRGQDVSIVGFSHNRLRVYVGAVFAATMLVLSVACYAGPSKRIDGSSHESFTTSHTDLIRSLSPGDQTRLVLAETVIRAAATPKPANPSTASPSLVPLEAVRGELDGKTFSEILALAKTKRTAVRVGFISEPGIEERAAAVVTLSGRFPGCNARGNLRDRGQEIPCDEVGSYLRDGLKVPCGAFVAISIQDGPSPDGMLALLSDLSAHGFTAVGSVGFVRECDRDR